VDDGRVLVEDRGDARRSHAERLPSDILTALDRCGLAVSDIDLFAIAAGPGLFTGLRIGIATIQGLAFVTRKRVVPVSALTALAEAGSADLPEGAIVGAWMDAHRRDVFSALFQVSGAVPCAIDRLTEIDPPAVGDPASVLARWDAGGRGPHTLSGDGAVLYADLVAGRARLLVPPLLAGIIGRIAEARAQAGETVDPAGVQPLYVRRPDAEVARDHLGHTGAP
jgi:tRNA threonylcarbamoyladenosine biosynthesis protein TsaB